MAKSREAKASTGAPVKLRRAASAGDHDLISLGTQQSLIPVQIGDKIIDLFSEGLYRSPNKAVEELVANSFDAGAKNVNVFVSQPIEDVDATIAVIDDGIGMGPKDLKRHWQVGFSDKRSVGYVSPSGRTPIGRFGIGKLATYVLGGHFTHVTKAGGRYYAASMDYKQIPSEDAVGVTISGSKGMQIPLRTLTEAQAKQLLAPWPVQDLFGPKSSPTFTAAIISNLRDMAGGLLIGRLGWILSTAMPVSNDFNIKLNGKILRASREKDLKKRWILGKDVLALDKLTFKKLSNSARSEPDCKKFGLEDDRLGKIYGYFELYDRLLTEGKATGNGRSNGFFIYTRDRLINVDDEYFGTESNQLKHGALARFRMVLYVDALDTEMRSSREGVREGAKVNRVREILNACFRIVRNEFERLQREESSEGQISGRISNVPAQYTVDPMISLLLSTRSGKTKPRLLQPIDAVDQKDFDSRIKALQARARTELVVEVVNNDVSIDSGICAFAADSGVLTINTLHPFVANFFDEYESKKHNVPLRLFAVSEVLQEAQLYQQIPDAASVAAILERRDQLLRYLARSQGRRTSKSIAAALRDAASDKSALEKELLACFQQLNFEAVPKGGNGKPDGIAFARLPGKKNGSTGAFSVSLEAKSKEDPAKRVSTVNATPSRLARHREDFECDFAFVVGPSFNSDGGESSALYQELKASRESTKKNITFAKIGDFAAYVELAAAKRLNLEHHRHMLQTCSMPQDFTKYVEKLRTRTVKKVPIRAVLEAAWDLQTVRSGSVANFGSIGTRLLDPKWGVDVSDEVIRDICQSIQHQMPDYVIVNNSEVTLYVMPSSILDRLSALDDEEATVAESVAPVPSSVRGKKKKKTSSKKVALRKGGKRSR